MGEPESSASAVRAFRAFLDDDWQRWLSEYPELATMVGHPEFNDRWTDDSPEGLSLRREHLSRSRELLAEADRDALPATERLNYDLYHDLLQTAEEGVAFGDDPLPFHLGVPHNYWMPMTQLEGIHQTASDVLALQPRETLAQYDDICARLRALPVAVDQNLALLEEGRKKGYTPPRVSVRSLPEQVAALIPSDPATSALWEPLAEFPARVGAADRERLRDEARQVYTEGIVPAFQRLHDYLVDRYLPECRESISASELPNGAATYRYRVRWQTTTELSPQEIHDIGLAEVHRLRGEMEAVIRATGFSGRFEEFSHFVRTDPRFFYQQADDLLDGFRVIAKKADPGLARLFGRLPRLPYGILPVPDFRAPASPSAYYIPGSPSAGRPGYFYVNTHQLSARPRWAMEALTLHEAVPGHHLQLALAQEVADVPGFRRETGPTAFTEGWGLYAESLGHELGFYRDPYSRFGQLNNDMWRSIRLVIDTGIHAFGWSRDRAIEFFRENGGSTEHDIGAEVDRYIVWPGQALAYKIGQLKIRELRTFAENRLGERFDVRAFHDAVLEYGALPLGELESRVRRWVEALATAGR